MQRASRTRISRAAAAVVLSTLALSFAGCGGGDDGDGAAEATTTTQVPSGCVEPPVTVDLQAAGDRPAGSSEFRVLDAVALRTPILPKEMAFDAAGIDGLQSRAEVTPLAVYSLYLADYEVDQEVITGRDLGQITPGPGQTVGVLRLVPAVETGLVEGDVVTDGDLAFEANTAFRPLSLAVYTDGDATAQAYTDVTGQAEVLQLDDRTMCVQFDVTYENAGEVVYTAQGTVLAPVVRSGGAFFFT